MSAPCRKPWCTNHTEDGVNGQPVHQGSSITMPAPEAASGLETLISAQLYVDEFYDTAEVFIGVGEYEEFALDDAGVIALAEGFEAFARQLREMRAATRPKLIPPAVEPGQVLGTDGKVYPSRVSVDDREFLFGRVHYLSHDASMSVRQIIAQLAAEVGVRRSVGWVVATLKRPCEACVQGVTSDTPEHPADGVGAWPPPPTPSRPGMTSPAARPTANAATGTAPHGSTARPSTASATTSPATAASCTPRPRCRASPNRSPARAGPSTRRRSD